MKVNCLTCQELFFPKNSNIKLGWGKYCSKKCHYQSIRNGEKRRSLVCEGAFYISNSKILDKRGKYCSRKCYYDSRKKYGSWNKGKKFPNLQGPNSSNWKGGVTPINRIIRTSPEYKIWRKAVYERDNYTCIWGGKAHGDRLNADHIKPFSLYPELRFSVDNGRTLCAECHKLTDTFGGGSFTKKYV